MKAVLEKVVYQVGKTVRLERIVSSYCTAPWHFHPEYELVLINKGYGNRYVGDHYSVFKEDDLVFLGHNLPHIWVNDPLFNIQNTNLFSDYYVLQFDDSHLPSQLLEFPEFKNIRALLEYSRYGLRVKDNSIKKVRKIMEQMLQSEGIERYLLFLQLLDMLGQSTDIEKLASNGYVKNYSIPTNERLQKVYQFAMENYHDKITIREVADIASMNEASFCRYFKDKTGRTFTEFLNEIKIGASCRLISENNCSIAQGAYESGFNNLSYYNRQFKKLMKITPNEYLKKQLQKREPR